MEYSNSSQARSGLHQIQRFIIRVVLIITGLILIGLTIGLVTPILIFTVGDALNWQIFDMQIMHPSIQDLEMEIFGQASASIFYKICLGFLIGIPLGMLFYTGIRFILGLAYSSTLGSTVFHVWLISLVVLIFFAYRGFKNSDQEILLQNKKHTQIDMLQKGLEIATEPFRKTKYVQINSNARNNKI